MVTLARRAAFALLLAALLLAGPVACGGVASSGLPPPAAFPDLTRPPAPTGAPINRPVAETPTVAPPASGVTAARSDTGSSRQPTIAETLDRQVAEFRYSAVSAGSHTCMLRTDGAAVCWGRAPVPPPAGRYSAISVGGYQSCGVRSNGDLECWGDRSYDRFDWFDTPAGKFQSISVGSSHTCGVRSNGMVACWGKNIDNLGNILGQATPPEGIFLSVSAGDDRTCGIRADNSLECWGYDYRPAQINGTQPEGKFRSVSVGGYHSCALRIDGRIKCWGDNSNGKATPSDGVFTAVSAGDEHNCGLRPSGLAVCWGFNNQGQADPPADTFIAVSAGANRTCGLRTDGSPRCWGTDEGGSATPPGISLDRIYTCNLGMAGRLECRRDDPYDEIMPPVGNFAAVSASRDHMCALLTTEAIACLNHYGDYLEYVHSELPGQGYVAVSAVATYACGLRGDGRLWCSSYRDEQTAELITGRFRSVSVGENYACAVTTGGAAQCWTHTRGIRASHEHIPPTTPPARRDFSSISVGKWHACGVVADGSVECWGDNYGYYEYCIADSYGMPHCGLTKRTDYIGQAAPPDGRFVAVSAGNQHTCGIRYDGTAECWGSAHSGHATPPPGRFAAVAAAYFQTCGIRQDGSIECWGDGIYREDYGAVMASVCLVTAADAAECRRSYHRTAPRRPAGMFASLDTGPGFACGVRADGALKCWGRIPGVIIVTR